MPPSPDLLARVPLFQELDEDDLHRLAQVTEVRTFGEGQNLFEIGESGRTLYILTRGTIQVLRPSRGAPVQLARIDPGDFVGEMALLDEAPRSATAKAATDVEALVLDKSAFRELVLSRPQVGLKLLQAMSRRIRRADEQIGGLSSQLVVDPVTGLLNHAAFDQRLDEETARARRYGGAFSLILVDIEAFDSMLEEHGRDVADAVLGWTGRLLHQHTRASDVSFRFDPSVFAVLCPWAGSEVSDIVARRLKALTKDARPPVAPEIGLALAIGTATCPDDGKERLPLYHHAQRALAASRAGGS